MNTRETITREAINHSWTVDHDGLDELVLVRADVRVHLEFSISGALTHVSRNYRRYSGAGRRDVVLGWLRERQALSCGCGAPRRQLHSPASPRTLLEPGWKCGESPTELFVVCCGRAKLDRPAPAGLLYTDSHFRFVLDGVERAAAGRPLRILSARHGLVDTNTELAPYDVTMTDPRSIPAADLAAQLTTLTGAGTLDVHAFLPRPYLHRLTDALLRLGRPETWTVRDYYRCCRGIGQQRRVIAGLAAEGGGQRGG